MHGQGYSGEGLWLFFSFCSVAMGLGWGLPGRKTGVQMDGLHYGLMGASFIAVAGVVIVRDRAVRGRRG